MKKTFIYIFYLFLFFVAGFYFIKTSWQVLSYFQLNKKKICRVGKWEIKKSRGGKYYIGAHYNFLVDGQKINGHTFFSSRLFWNKQTAYDVISQWNERAWYVWYSRKNPSFSTLEKDFPIKSTVYTIICLSVVVYFFTLHRKINKET